MWKDSFDFCDRFKIPILLYLYIASLSLQGTRDKYSHAHNKSLIWIINFTFTYLCKGWEERESSALEIIQGVVGEAARQVLLMDSCIISVETNQKGRSGEPGSSDSEIEADAF